MYEDILNSFAIPSHFLTDKCITATEVLLKQQLSKKYFKKFIKQIEKTLIHPAIKIAYKIILQQAIKEKIRLYELKMIKTM